MYPDYGMIKGTRHLGRRGAGGVSYSGLIASACFAIAQISSDKIRAQEWSQYAGDAAHTAAAVSAPADLSAKLWTVSQNQSGVSLVFEGPSSPVVLDGRLFANARMFSGTTHVANKMVAIDIETGAVEWEAPIAKSILNSWSSPAIDVAQGTVLIGSGNTLYAFNLADGSPAWATPLLRNIVNASPVVAEGRSPGRAFVTDYDGAGSNGSLYCVNTSAFDAIDNPYQPGEIVWRELLGGSSGNTPACRGDVVYVASVTDATEPGFPGTGHIFAFHIDGGDGDRLIWSTGAGEGFFGGLTVQGDFVFAASYDPFGAQDNSTLVKIRAEDGALIWTTPCERTNSIPVVSGDHIYLAGGIPGFGSAPKVEAFLDFGGSVSKLWDTYQDTAGALLVGGWTHQPAVYGDTLYCGTISTGNAFFGAYTDLYLLNLAVDPSHPDFIVDHRTGAGSSPAVCGGRVYSIGAGGLSAFGTRGDICASGTGAGPADGVVNGADIQCFVSIFLNGSPTPSELALVDFDEDGMVTVNDVQLLIDKLTGE